MQSFSRTNVSAALLLAAFGFAANASASGLMHSQRLAPPVVVEGGTAYLSPVVSGDWIAVFGRLSPASGDGQIFVYHRVGGQWSYFQTLSPPDSADCNDALLFSGSTLFAACSSAIDDTMEAAIGLVTEYTFDGQQWQVEQTIRSATGYMGASGFGTSLAVTDNLLFVGYPGYIPYTNGGSSGDVEVFDVSTNPATFYTQIVPSEPVPLSNFGSSLSATSGQLAVGANNQDLQNVGPGAGVVYTFAYSGGNWVQGSIVTSATPYANDNFPSSLVFHNSQLVAGSATTDSYAKGGALGVVFTYASSGDGMLFDNAIYPTETLGNTMFGLSVAPYSNVVSVAEPNGGDGGRIHLYSWLNGVWNHTSAFITAGTQLSDELGVTMTTDGETLVIGASESGRSPATMGAVYVVENPPTDQIFADGSEP